VAKKRTYGTGQLYEKHGAYYGRWWTLDGRQPNRRIGPVRTPGSKDGLTRAQAEAAFRRVQDEEERAPRLARGMVVPTVDDIADSLRARSSDCAACAAPTSRVASRCSACTSPRASANGR
jgi:hypothetical protein